MSSACNYEGCTVGETGVCALERDPANCDRRAEAGFSRNAVAPGAGSQSESVGSPVLEPPPGRASFPSSQTLGLEAIAGLMASRYVTVVGILGEPNSGKTACLASMYLLVANAMLNGWRFADSKSLMGFEDIARGARDWNAGSPPAQMTMRTEMTEDRRAGFLHLRLVRELDGKCVDLALPDIPGEWTTKLVTSAQSDRLDFIRAADVIWVVLDGRTLAESERRQGLISRTGQLAGRLKTMCGDRLPRVIVVITHRDGGEVAEPISTRLLLELKRKDVEATIVQVAPFSDSDGVRAGFGIADLIDATAGTAITAPAIWPDGPVRESARSFLRYRRDR